MKSECNQLDRQRRRLVGLGVLCGLCVAWLLIERSVASSQLSAQESLVRQIRQMHSDAAAIRRMRLSPKLATERERPNDALLEEIRHALEEAAIPLDRWTRSTPSPATQVPDTAYKRLSTRIELEAVTLKQTALFLYALVDTNSALDVSRVKMSSGAQKGKADLHVVSDITYYIYAPHEATAVP